MKYDYKATKKDGEFVTGNMVADDEFSLNRALREQGLELLSADDESARKWHKWIEKALEMGSVSMAEKINFGRNLSAMLEAGLSLSRAISVMDRQTKNKKFKKILLNINNDIKKGSSFSDSLGEHKKTFSPLFVSMVRAGEEAGNLVESLKVVASQMDKSDQLQKRIRGAMIYPGVIMSAMAVIGVFMMIYIVPTLTGTFQELGVELPGTTQFIISISDLFVNHTIFILLILLVFGGLIYTAIKTKRGKRILDIIFIHLPLIAPLVKETNSARTARTLSALLSSGVPYLESVKITKDVVQNSYYKKILEKAEKNIELGIPVSKVFSDADKYYPVFVGEMIAVGEETGELSEMLMRVATYYENEVEQKTKNMSTIVEPFLMIIVGAAVGFFAVSMISPMYQLVDQI